MARRVPILYRSIIFFISMAASFILIGWFRQFTLLLGNHIKATVIIIIQCFICLSLGSSVAGRLADRIPKPLYVNVGMLFAAALIAFFQKPYFRLVITLFKPDDIVPLDLLPIITLVIPLSLLTGSIPLLIRHFLRNISHAGLFMSATLISVSASIVIAVLLSVLFIVPYLGTDALFISGGILLTLAASASFYKPSSQFFPEPSVKVSMKFKKKRIVLGTAAKLTRAMLYSSAFQAFSFSSVLIIYCRILIKTNSFNPVFFYSAVLLIVFSGLATGSTFYKIIADKPANKYLTLAILQIIAGLSSLLSFGMYQMLAPEIFSGVGTNMDPLKIAVLHFLVISLLVFIPSVIHGMSFPLAGRLYPRRIQHIGRVFGRLNSIILFSFAVGISFTSIVLIPLIGINPSFIFISMVVVMSGIYLILRDSRLIRAFRFAFAFGSLLTFFLILAILRMLNVSQYNRMADGIYEGSTASVKYVMNPDSSEVVSINGIKYFGTNDTSINEQILSSYIPVILEPGIRSALVIGFNTGISAAQLVKFGVSDVYITETSSEIIRLSSSVFSSANYDVLTNSAVDVYLSDPRRFMVKHSERYDLILSGSDQLLLYPGRYTTDFFRLTYEKLSEKGLYCQAIPYQSIDSTVFTTIYNTCASVFEYTSLWNLHKGRLLIIAGRFDPITDYCLLSERISANLPALIERMGINSADSLLNRFVFKGNPFSQMDLPNNTDQIPELEFRDFFKMQKNRYSDYITGYADPANDFFLSDSCDTGR